VGGRGKTQKINALDEKRISIRIEKTKYTFSRDATCCYPQKERGLQKVLSAGEGGDEYRKGSKEKPNQSDVDRLQIENINLAYAKG